MVSLDRVERERERATLRQEASRGGINGVPGQGRERERATLRQEASRGGINGVPGQVERESNFTSRSIKGGNQWCPWTG